MTDIMAGPKEPNRKQQLFLEHFVRRLKVEWHEKQQGNVNSTPEEPLLDVVHGLLGTGSTLLASVAASFNIVAVQGEGEKEKAIHLEAQILAGLTHCNFIVPSSSAARPIFCFS